MAPTPANYAWRYILGRAVRHLLHANNTIAECGQNSRGWRDWHGAGSQREYEHCAQLRPCRRCVALVPPGADWEVPT